MMDLVKEMVHLQPVVVLQASLGVIVTLIFHSVHQLCVSMEAIALKVMVLQLHVFAHKELMEQVVKYNAKWHPEFLNNLKVCPPI